MRGPCSMQTSGPWHTALALLPLLLSSLPLSYCDSFSFVKAEGKDICAGIKESCTTTNDCTVAAYGPCSAASPGPSAYVTLTPFMLGWIHDLNTYSTDSSKVTSIGGLPNINNGFRDSSPNVAVGSAAYAYMTTGALVGTDKTSAGYIGTINAIMTKGDVSTKTIPVSFNTVDDIPSDHSTKLKVDMCVTATSNKQCSGSEVSFFSGDIAFMTYGGTMGSNFIPHPFAKNIFVRYTMTVVDSNKTSAGMTFNTQSKKLSEMSNVEVNDITFTLGGKMISLELSKAFNAATFSVAGTTVSLSNHTTGTVQIRVSAVPGDAMSAYLDVIFPAAYLQTANQIVFYGSAGVAGRRAESPGYSRWLVTAPPASPSSPTEQPQAASPATTPKASESLSSTTIASATGSMVCSMFTMMLVMYLSSRAL
ncbi:hypothetical protein GUITHDRAFT_121751 [Guillardia theta CCMP2712]|uniref:Uncharacterized protein n=1 Tax=Guillardia theta (strain CCMP2712) TaxID=905079 RepID=L1I893_GUITC|nr:hypothetical protein GUITHDRAFT_121751 [Guillardia theta CCMP2712]EKX32075.1 hypothetical protein GUITHDRAFT_121751 [Guillardia theta CCMP2712]|eukprot:XP_005819055.1 hypothetical protein GUITHDRAFT_121751 [Guillardia theta CCMP2712]